MKRKHNMMEELRYIQIQHGDMSQDDKRLMSANQSQVERMHNNELVSYIAGARILANYNKKNRTAGGRNQKITDFFKKREPRNNNEKEDRSELGPGEPFKKKGSKPQS
jgi:hypothetical protein